MGVENQALGGGLAWVLEHSKGGDAGVGGGRHWGKVECGTATYSQQLNRQPETFTGREPWQPTVLIMVAVPGLRQVQKKAEFYHVASKHFGGVDLVSK